jgi:hypothetical protein
MLEEMTFVAAGRVRTVSERTEPEPFNYEPVQYWHQQTVQKISGF